MEPPSLERSHGHGQTGIVANRGMLPELVEHGISGLVVNDSPEELVPGNPSTASSSGNEGGLGKSSLLEGPSGLPVGSTVEAVEGFYQEMMKLGKRT